jgi:hypothetical protein
MMQTKTKKRVQEHGEVYTNHREVNAMLDLVPCEIDTTFLEPSCGNGAFLKEILNSKLKLCSNETEATIAVGSVFGIDILQDNVEETISSMVEIVMLYFPFLQNKALKTFQNNIVQGDFLTATNSKGESIWFLENSIHTQQMILDMS